MKTSDKLVFDYLVDDHDTQGVQVWTVYRIRCRHTHMHLALCDTWIASFFFRDESPLKMNSLELEGRQYGRFAVLGLWSWVRC